MTASHVMTAHEVGMIRIYMKPGDRGRVAGGVKTFFAGKPQLYRQVVQAAKAAGIMNAIAHNGHYGYSNHGRIQDEGVEIANPELTMCVELIGDREQLETFCRDHGALLSGKVMIYKHLERWRLEAQALDQREIVPGAEAVG
ncbi:MAG: hypothetical protein EON94_07715 [Caulobacteraceae bacterium]|nr:MAG: hypothetical protein EON94_07715 [Caulobacteraceae bacterium]